jgi:transglutaminase-like putative cysteine protease
MMRFEITHSTDYRYQGAAIEAYLEARLTPPDTATQRILSHRIEIVPDLPTSFYTDTFGNPVAFFSHTLRHERLAIVNRLEVETCAPHLPEEALDVSVAEARQLFPRCCSITSTTCNRRRMRRSAATRRRGRGNICARA